VNQHHFNPYSKSGWCCGPCLLLQLRTGRVFESSLYVASHGTSRREKLVLRLVWEVTPGHITRHVSPRGMRVTYMTREPDFRFRTLELQSYQESSTQFSGCKPKRHGRETRGRDPRVPVITEYTHNGVSPPEHFLHVAKIRIFSRVGSKPAQPTLFFFFFFFFFFFYSPSPCSPLLDPPFSPPPCPLLQQRSACLFCDLKK
jgi:hypothetical protein